MRDAPSSRSRRGLPAANRLATRELVVPPGGLRKAPTKGSKVNVGGVVPHFTADDHMRSKSPSKHGKVTRTAVARGTSDFRAATSNASAAKAVFEAEKGKGSKGGPGGLTKVPSSKQRTGVQTTVRSNTGATHSFAESETIAFSEFINETLGKDEGVAHLLPINGRRPQQQGSTSGD